MVMESHLSLLASYTTLRFAFHKQGTACVILKGNRLNRLCTMEEEG